MITVTQNAIKIGDSLGVTLPAKEVKRLGIQPGDTLKISVEYIGRAQNDVITDYEAFKAQYGETLKNLANR